MSGLGASRVETMLKAGGAKMVAALRGGMKRFHLGGAAIKAAHVADERPRQERRHIDVLKLVVDPADGAMNVHKEWLHATRGARYRSFQSSKLLPE